MLEKLWQWLELQKDACPKSSALGKAIGYALKRRAMLSRFLEDGALPLDNNRCERAIRPVVMGRSNWLFAGSAGRASVPQDNLDAVLPLQGFTFGEKDA